MQKVNLTQLAKSIQAYKNCISSNNKEWKVKHIETIKQICRNLPSGSGINTGTHLSLDKSNENKIVFHFEFQHMEEGYYTEWTGHKATVTPTFGGFDINISGRNKNDVKEYLYDVFFNTFEI